ncbi:MAG: hypothetical protein VYE81_06355 [Planctomycetota bacterium]|nr:hypothetical protein [Planctomycetota bacterium]
MLRRRDMRAAGGALALTSLGHAGPDAASPAPFRSPKEPGGRFDSVKALTFDVFGTISWELRTGTRPTALLAQPAVRLKRP